MYPDQDAERTADVRAKDLLSRMSLEEKAAQMVRVWQRKAATLVDAEGNFDPERARAADGEGHGLGQVGRPRDAGGGKDARAMAELTNAIQRFLRKWIEAFQVEGHPRLATRAKRGFPRLNDLRRSRWGWASVSPAGARPKPAIARIFIPGDGRAAVIAFFVENIRLGIPVVFHDERLHGLAGPGATG